MEGTFNRILERFLVFSIAVSLILTATGVFSTVINKAEFEVEYINIFTYIIFLVSGLIFTLVLQIFALEKIKAAMHIVFIFFYIVIVLVIAAIFGQGYTPYALIPFLILEYFIEAGINDMFILHDRFLYECENLEGKDLETYLFHNNLSAIDLTEKTKGQQAVLFGLCVAMFIIIVFGKLSEGLFNPIIIALILIFYLSVLLCYFMLGLFRNDIFYAFLGFKNIVKDRKRLFRSVFLIFMISAGAAALISSDNPLIKIHYVEDYRDTQKQKQLKHYEEKVFAEPIIENPNEFLGLQEGKPNWIIEFIYSLIKYAAIVSLAGGLIYFFIRPFFTNHWRIFWSEGRLFKFLHDVWEDIKLFFHFMFSKDSKTIEQYSTVQSKKFHDTMMDFLKKSKRTKEKEAEIDRLTKYFMRLIDWGESHKIKYRPNLAPAEYTALFKNENAETAGSLFEKALYDKNVLNAEEEKSFITAIQNIIRN